VLLFRAVIALFFDALWRQVVVTATIEHVSGGDRFVELSPVASAVKAVEVACHWLGYLTAL